jgi:hypothetical protein
MPVIAIILGVIMIDLGYRGTEHDFSKQLGQDFSGGTFWAWMASIVILGSIGFYSPLKKISDLALGLVIVAMVFSNKGIFATISQEFTNPPSATAAVALPSFSSSSSSGSSSGGSSSGVSSLALTAVEAYFGY